MTNPVYALHKSQEDFENRALGYGQRRVTLVALMLGGMSISGGGLGWFLGAAAVGEPMRSGLFMVGVGLVLTGIGWGASAGLRFTRRLPKPLERAYRVEPAMQSSIIGAWIAFALVVAASIAIVLFAPRGGESDVWAILPILPAFTGVVLVGLIHNRRIMRSRNELYTAWLQKHHSATP